MKNDRIINVPISKIVEAIMKGIDRYKLNLDGFEKLEIEDAIETALASLGREWQINVSPHSVLNRHFRKNGSKKLTDWEAGIVVEAMKEYASQFTHPSEREVLPLNNDRDKK